MFKQNKQYAVALAIMCATPLLAQAQSNVVVYGKLFPQITSTKVTGASGPGTPVSTLIGPAAGAADEDATSLDSNGSRFGFRGSEDLGGGLKAIFQLEAGVDVDTGVAGSSGALFSRNTFVGLTGGFGTVKVGKMDTVYKTIGDRLSFFGISSGNFLSLDEVLSKPAFGTSNASFHLRPNNTLMYESPTFSGLQLLANYSLGERAEDTRRGSLLSVGATYATGPWYFALAHERHYEFFGGSRNVRSALRNLDSARNPLGGATAEDNATRATALYKFANGLRLEANVARLEYDEQGGAVGRFDNYRTTTWSLAAEQKIGALGLAASYAQGNEGTCALVGGIGCSTAGLGSKQLNLGVNYSLSKRTAVFLIAGMLRNDESARRNNNESLDVAAGQDTRHAAIGINHSF